MTPALFRVRLADGTFRLATGDSVDGPAAMLDPQLSLDMLLSAASPDLAAVCTVNRPGFDGGSVCQG